MSAKSIRKARAAFEKAVLPHTSALFGSAFRLTRNHGDAEDLVQDTMLRAYRFWGSFQEGSNCKAWLFKILTNTFISSYQRRKRSKEVLDAAINQQKTTDGTLIQSRSIAQRSPADKLIENCLSEDIQNALAAIPADFRVAVVLCDVESFSYKEISEILECPVGTVMSRLYRGRRLLQNELKDFAIAQGVLNDPSAGKSQQTANKTIDLQEYRKRQVAPQQ